MKFLTASRPSSEIRGTSLEIRKTVAQPTAGPLIGSMHKWIKDTLAKLSRKSDTAAAIRYAITRCPALTRYVNEGTIETDHNDPERELRVGFGRNPHECLAAEPAIGN